jgi:hypothetical protein
MIRTQQRVALADSTSFQLLIMRWNLPRRSDDFLLAVNGRMSPGVSGCSSCLLGPKRSSKPNKCSANWTRVRTAAIAPRMPNKSIASIQTRVAHDAGAEGERTADRQGCPRPFTLRKISANRLQGRMQVAPEKGALAAEQRLAAGRIQVAPRSIGTRRRSGAGTSGQSELVQPSQRPPHRRLPAPRRSLRRPQGTAARESSERGVRAGAEGRALCIRGSAPRSLG